jgi:hypothetical protein
MVRCFAALVRRFPAEFSRADPASGTSYCLPSHHSFVNFDENRPKKRLLALFDGVFRCGFGGTPAHGKDSLTRN